MTWCIKWKSKTTRRIGWKRWLMQWRLNWDPILSKSSRPSFSSGCPYEADILFNRSDGSETGGKSSKKRSSEGKLAALKAELNDALSKPLVARGVSLMYITSGTRAIADDLIAGNSKCSQAVLLNEFRQFLFTQRSWNNAWPIQVESRSWSY